MDRRLLFGTIGGALMVAGVGVLGIEALHLPKVAVVAFLGVLFVVGGWLTIAALFALPPARPAPPEIHAEHVRRLVELAASGGRFEAGSSERRMLNAHYPRISRAHEAVEGSAQAETGAWDQLMQEVTAAVVQRFDGPLWARGGIRDEAQRRLHDQTTRVKDVRADLRLPPEPRARASAAGQLPGLWTARCTTPLPRRRSVGSTEIGWLSSPGRARTAASTSSTAASDAEGFESGPTMCG
jgi:hypothetical protein